MKGNRTMTEKELLDTISQVCLKRVGKEENIKNKMAYFDAGLHLDKLSRYYDKLTPILDREIRKIEKEEKER